MFSKESKSSNTSAVVNGAMDSHTTNAGVPSIISADLTIVGNLKSGGDIQIDGTVEGDIDSRTLTIGEGATVKGSIVAETVRISGNIVGQVKANAVTLVKTAKVTGDITHETLTMEAGAFLEGGVRRLEAGAFSASAKVSPFRAPQNGSAGDSSLSEPISNSL
ncbi:MAG: bactofilin family protein [Alphaproteobacteria bacterium]